MKNKIALLFFVVNLSIAANSCAMNGFRGLNDRKKAIIILFTLGTTSGALAYFCGDSKKNNEDYYSYWQNMSTTKKVLMAASGTAFVIGGILLGTEISFATTNEVSVGISSNSNTIHGKCDYVSGSGNTVNGSFNYVPGNDNIVNGSWNYVPGSENEVNGSWGRVLGNNNTVNANFKIVCGNGNTYN